MPGDSEREETRVLLLSDQEAWEQMMKDVENGEEPLGSFSHKSPDLTNPVSAVWSLKART